MLVSGSQGDGLQDKDEQGQAHGQLRKNVVKVMVQAKYKRCTASAEFIQSLLVLLSAITESLAAQMPLDCFGTNARQG
jgi:hypothetical protein